MTFLDMVMLATDASTTNALTPLIDVSKTGGSAVLCLLLIYMVCYQTPQNLKDMKEQANAITSVVKQALDASTEEQAAMRKAFSSESAAMRAAFTAQYESLAKRFEDALTVICERNERSDQRLLQLMQSQLEHQRQHHSES